MINYIKLENILKELVLNKIILEEITDNEKSKTIYINPNYLSNKTYLVTKLGETGFTISTEGSNGIIINYKTINDVIDECFDTQTEFEKVNTVISELEIESIDCEKNLRLILNGIASDSDISDEVKSICNLIKEKTVPN